MARAKIAFVCTACGASSPKWEGRCPECGDWNTLEEARVESVRPARAVGYAGESARTMAELAAEPDERISTGIGELDRVLGGGLVAGSVALIGGDPGIGKSTLLLQAAAALPDDATALYVTGEESLRQVASRAQRLGLDAQGLQLLAETSVEGLVGQARGMKPSVMIVDSIQTVYSEELQSAPGSVAQLRESAARLVRFAKTTGTAVLLVGHVTKDGAIAGPRVLEHMVDTVLYFESDAASRFRVIRTRKNRFGTANEIGVFAMTGEGLREVRNPSSLFLSGHEDPVPGSIVMVTREGSRPLMVEVQALVDTSHLGNPRRVAAGMDANRLALLLAVLHRHAGVAMYDQDVFINVVGGVRVTETAVDLPVLLAALSSLRDRPVSRKLVAFGEVGLAGEIRPVPYGEERLREAAKHGFRRAIVPAGNAPRQPIRGTEGLQITAVRRLGEAVEALYGGD
jgi:DNA repair protein RadA/Sms